MSAQSKLDKELEWRNLNLLKPETIAQVRALCKRPATGIDILHERLLNGVAALDDHETDYRWQLFELILTAWRCCQDARDEARYQGEQAYIQALRNDPELRAMRRRAAALSQRSLREYVAYERSKIEGLPEESETPQKQMVTGPMTVKGRTNPKWQ